MVQNEMMIRNSPARSRNLVFEALSLKRHLRGDRDIIVAAVAGSRIV
jgi:hypothetical protein